MKDEKRNSRKSMELLSRLAEEGRKIFTVEDAKIAAKALDIEEKNVNLMLHRLKQDEWIVSLKKGMYALSKGFSLSPIHEFEIAMALKTHSAISHFSAFHYHSLTDQIPLDVFILTSEKNVPRIGEKFGTVRIRGVSYRFIQVIESKFFGIEEQWVNETKVRITDLERTLIDGLIRPQFCGGFEEVIHAFSIAKERLNLAKLIEYALKMEAVIAKRLGWILSKIGYSDEELLPLKQVTVISFRKLDPTRPAVGPCNSQWMIQENLYV